jgi:hypothetical protein
VEPCRCQSRFRQWVQEPLVGFIRRGGASLGLLVAVAAWARRCFSFSFSFIFFLYVYGGIMMSPRHGWAEWPSLLLQFVVATLCV